MSFWSTLADIGKVVANPVGSIISGVFDSAAQSSANETNVEMQRETNAQNYKMFKEQLGFTENMWNKSNEYNTPAKQRERYEQAGINPYMALGAITGGNAQTVSSPSPNPAVSPHVIPNTGMANAMANVANGLNDSLLKSSQADNLNADTQAKMISNMFSIQREITGLREKEAVITETLSRSNLNEEERRNKIKQRRLLRLEIRDKQAYLKYADELYKAKTDSQREMANYNREQAREMALKADYQQLVNDAFPALNQAQLNVLSAQAYQAVMSGKLSADMSANEQLKAAGIMLDNSIKSGEVTLQQLGITEKELEAARRGDVQKLRGKSKIWRLVDDIVSYAADTGSTLLGFGVGYASKGLASKPTKVKGFR